MEIKKHSCPLCKNELQFLERYPNYICAECTDRATDSKGRKLTFRNISFDGGFEAFYRDTNEIYDSHVCFVDNVKCYADEARFGGIIVEIMVSVQNSENPPLEIDKV